MKRISLDQLLDSSCGDMPYSKQHRYIMQLIEKGEIKPLKASGANGKKPALFREYWKLEPEKDYSSLKEELKYSLNSRISVTYYLSHLECYEKERHWVLLLNDYLENKRERLSYKESVNERSFEIWNEEKFLSQGQGKTILKHCGMDEGFLNIYRTTEPLAYYSHTREIPQNMLILENKDTFYSMRKFLIEEKKDIFGMPVGTLIYGAGKKVLRTFQDFSLCVEPYMKEKHNKIYYFGDLDYEGIGIYENLARIFEEEWEICPFAQAYEMMMKKARKTGFEALPRTKEQQNRNITEHFFSYFPKELTGRMKAMLEAGKYIPQEIMSISDFYR